MDWNWPEELLTLLRDERKTTTHKKWVKLASTAKWLSKKGIKVIDFTLFLSQPATSPSVGQVNNLVNHDDGRGVKFTSSNNNTI